MYKKYKIVYFGTPEFSIPTLKLLQHNPLIEIVSVVSMPDRPAGRGQNLKSPEVVEYCKQHSIPFLQTENINKEINALEQFKECNVDLFIVLAFAQFLGANALSIPKLGSFNIHTSLLPKYRGAAPIQYAILNGDQSSGVSIQHMVKEMDAGDLVCELPCEVFPYEDSNLLSTRLSYLAAECCHHFINKLSTNLLVSKKQDSNNISFAPTIKKENGFIDFKSESSVQIINKLRAYSAWPGIYIFINGKRLKIIELEVSDLNLSAGEIHHSKDKLIIGSKDKSLELKVVQLEGKKICTTKELLNGFKPPFMLSKDIE